MAREKSKGELLGNRHGPHYDFAASSLILQANITCCKGISSFSLIMKRNRRTKHFHGIQLAKSMCLKAPSMVIAMDFIYLRSSDASSHAHVS